MPVAGDVAVVYTGAPVAKVPLAGEELTSEELSFH